MGWPDGAGLEMSDYNTWNKYKPWVNQVDFATAFRLDVDLRCPTCSTDDMRNFKIMGVDLIIGYGDPRPDFQNGGYFTGTANSFCIDGFHNFKTYGPDDQYYLGGLVWLDNKEAGTSHRAIMNFYHVDDGQVVKDAYNNNQYIDYAGSHRLLTMGLVKQILRENGVFFVRPWVRSRSACDRDADSPNGYIYAGYDNFHDPGKYGHTFNNGILVTVPRPGVKFLSDRVGEIRDGSNTQGPVDCQLVFDPSIFQYRAPRDNQTIAQSGGRCTFERRIQPWDPGYKMNWNIKVYANTDYGDMGATGRQVYALDIGSLSVNGDRDWNNNIPWTRNFTFNTADFNNVRNHQGNRVLIRVESYYGGTDNSWSEGPLDNGWSAYGWRDGPNHKVSCGLFLPYLQQHPDMVMYSVDNRCVNDKLPRFNEQVNVAPPTRVNNILRPGSIVHFLSNAVDDNGDAMSFSWKVRSKEVYDGNPNNNYWAKDVVMPDKYNTSEIRVNSDEIMELLESTFGKPVDGYGIGRETCAKDHFWNTGHKWESNLVYSGSGWTDYKLEYALANYRVNITGKPFATTPKGIRVVPGRFINVATNYDTVRIGTVKYYLEANFSVLPPASDNRESFPVSNCVWYASDKWQDMLAHWDPQREFNNLDLWALCKQNPKYRGQYIGFFSGAVTPGGWTYEKWSHQNANSDIAFLNKFPNCYNSLTDVTFNSQQIILELIDNKIATDRDTVLEEDLSIASNNISRKNMNSAWGNTSSAIDCSNIIDYNQAHYAFNVFIRYQFTVRKLDPSLKGVDFNIGIYCQTEDTKNHEWQKISTLGHILNDPDDGAPMLEEGKTYSGTTYGSISFPKDQKYLIPWVQVATDWGKARGAEFEIESCVMVLTPKYGITSNLQSVIHPDQCCINTSYNITDDNFNLKSAHVDLVCHDTNTCICLRQITGLNQKSVSYSDLFNITQVLLDNGKNDLNYIGKTMYVHVHGENQYEFSQTWDGTRGENGPWEKTFVYDRGPRAVQHISNNKGETVEVYITNEANYPRDIRYTIKVKLEGEPDSALKVIARGLEPNARATFNPRNEGYPVTNRGKRFEFKYDINTSSNGESALSFTNVSNEMNNLWTWNEVPVVTINDYKLTNPDNDNDNIINTGDIYGLRWGATMGFDISVDDPDTKTLIIYKNMSNVNIYLNQLYNIPGGYQSQHVVFDPHDLQKKYEADGYELYPISLQTGNENCLQYKAYASDDFGGVSSTADTETFLLLTPVRRRNITYRAGANAERVGDTVYGSTIIFNFDLEFDITSQFTSSSYKVSHCLMFDSADNPSGFPIPTNDGIFKHEGTHMPGNIDISVSIDNNKDNFNPGEKYKFILQTSVTDGNNQIYYIDSNYVGLYMFGTSPKKPQIIYPINRRQPYENPPLIIQIPHQTDVSNKNIDDVGLIMNGEFLGWNSDKNFGPIFGNYNGVTFGMTWNSKFGNNTTVKFKVRIHSEMTNMTQDSDEITVFCGYDNMIVNRGQEIQPFTNIRKSIDELRAAYGLPNWSYKDQPSNGLVRYVTFDNNVQTFLDAINDVKQFLAKYYVNYVPETITKPNVINANVTNIFQTILTKYKS